LTDVQPPYFPKKIAGRSINPARRPKDASLGLLFWLLNQEKNYFFPFFLGLAFFFAAMLVNLKIFYFFVFK